MEIALWIIAIIEIIRMIQNTMQLMAIHREKDMRKNLNNQFIDSLKKDNKEFCEDLLKDFLKQEGENHEG